MTTTWTYWAIQRPDWTSYSEGQGVIMTKDGLDVATATSAQRKKGRVRKDEICWCDIL